MTTSGLPRSPSLSTRQFHLSDERVVFLRGLMSALERRLREVVVIDKAGADWREAGGGDAHELKMAPLVVAAAEGPT